MAAEPLGLWRGDGEYDGVRVVELEYTSRGDRVPGHVWLPAGSGPFPLVVLQHGATGSRLETYLGTVGLPWVRGGAAIACIDLPLHGARGNPKLGGLVLGALGLAGRPTPEGRALLTEFVRQSVCDLQRLLDVAELLPELDAKRAAFAGLSLGAIVGTRFCAADPRVRAAALALAGGGFGGPDVDPATAVERIAPRPLLFVNMRGDQTVSAAATETLYAAAAEPKEIAWFEGDHRELPGAAMKKLWSFLRPHLDLD